jgi:hypothetical protein
VKLSPAVLAERYIPPNKAAPAELVGIHCTTLAALTRGSETTVDVPADKVKVPTTGRAFLMALTTSTAMDGSNG